MKESWVVFPTEIIGDTDSIQNHATPNKLKKNKDVNLYGLRPLCVNELIEVAILKNDLGFPQNPCF